MKILDIGDIEKKDTPLHYRNEYTANLRYEGMGKSEVMKKISFTIERDPLGKANIHINFHGILEYPLIPAKKKITEYILDLDRQGKLV